MNHDATNHLGPHVQIPLPGALPPRRQRRQTFGEMERRAHHRFPARKGAFALIRSHAGRIGPIGAMSLGQIGLAVYASKPCRVGPLIDISRGGAAFHASGGGPMALGTAVLDLLMAEKRLYLGGLRFQLVEDLKLPDDFVLVQPGRRLLRVRFINLTARQRIKLDRFIHICATHVH
ncbi:MAG: hypothetical protein LJE63_13880 [Desulfobacteraceae bacterium]|nr:hypothetical protein [Desulfobacteraceae bacterium]